MSQDPLSPPPENPTYVLPSISCMTAKTLIWLKAKNSKPKIATATTSSQKEKSGGEKLTTLKAKSLIHYISSGHILRCILKSSELKISKCREKKLAIIKENKLYNIYKNVRKFSVRK